MVFGHQLERFDAKLPGVVNLVHLRMVALADIGKYLVPVFQHGPRLQPEFVVFPLKVTALAKLQKLLLHKNFVLDAVLLLQLVVAFPQSFFDAFVDQLLLHLRQTFYPLPVPRRVALRPSKLGLAIFQQRARDPVFQVADLPQLEAAPLVLFCLQIDEEPLAAQVLFVLDQLRQTRGDFGFQMQIPHFGQLLFLVLHFALLVFLLQIVLEFEDFLV